jgi:hypothetical protein
VWLPISQALNAEMRELFDYEHQQDELDVQDVVSKILGGVEDKKQQQMILRITKAVTRSVVNNL